MTCRWVSLRSTHPTNCIAAMAAPTGSGRAGGSRFQLSHQSGATHRKNATLWCETTDGRHCLLNELTRLKPSRSEARRGGQEWVSTGRSRGGAEHKTKKKKRKK